MKLQSGDPKNWIGGMMRWRKITLNPKRRNYGNSTQILKCLACFEARFCLAKDREEMFQVFRCLLRDPNGLKCPTVRNFKRIQIPFFNMDEAILHLRETLA